MRRIKSFGEDGPAGRLYVVATPIGNLEDMTYRAVRVLQEADCIAAEDTRQTRKLLSRFYISGRLVSYHEHNKHASGAELIRMLQEGKSIALVSDAGMPGISDPGHDLVKLAAEAGIPVVPIPGANAALSALVVSGLATDRFLFLGFLPKEKKERQAVLDAYRSVRATVILYEAPHRLIRTLEQLLARWGDRRIALVRELTKRHEEVLRGTVQEALQELAEQPPRGEYVIVVEEPEGADAAEDSGRWWEGLDVTRHVQAYEARGMDRKEAIKLAAADRGVPKREIYNEVMRTSGG
jgi:16S rRNA (cytidine1402-2'-O)-methyltransferase